MPDPRIATVITSVQKLVIKTGGGLSGTLSPEQLLTLIAAAAVDDQCRKALVGLVYGAVETANRIDREHREAGDLEQQLRASLKGAHQ